MLAEGIILAHVAGLNMVKVLELLALGSAQPWWLENHAEPIIGDELIQEDDGITMMHKDFGICNQGANRREIALPITSLIAQFYSAVKARGGSDLEGTSLLTLWSRRFG